MSGEKFTKYSLDESACFRAIREMEEELAQEIALLEPATNIDFKAENAEVLALARTRLAEVLEEKRHMEALANHSRGQQTIAMLDNYRQAYLSFQDGMKSQAELEEKMPGLKLPALTEQPEEPSAAMSDKQIHEAHLRLREIASAYQKAVDEAIASYQATAQAVEKMTAWVSGFRTRVMRSATDINQTLLAKSVLADTTALNDRLKRMASRAMEIFEELTQGHPNVEVSSEVLSCLDAVFEAEEEVAAAMALETLRSAVIAHKATIDREAEQKRAKSAQSEVIRERKRRAVIAGQAARALEDLGYEVSHVSDSAFVEDGHVFAVHGEWPDHAICFEFDPNQDSLVARPLRVINETAAMSSTADVKTDDAAFDKSWCSKDGLGKFRELLKTRGVKTEFKQAQRAGAAAIEHVTTPKIVRDLQEKAKRSRRSTTKLRSRPSPK